MKNNIPIIFDRKLLIKKKERAAKIFNQCDFLYDSVASEIVERVSNTNMDFKYILDLGSNNGLLTKKLKNQDSSALIFSSDICYEMISTNLGNKIVFDEEKIPFANNIFDLVVSNLVLHFANDLPGCLVQLKQILNQEALMIGAVFGPRTLYQLRESMLSAELDLNLPATPHIAPFIDIKDMGSLLQRVGFKTVIVDSDIINVEYSSLKKLFFDLRGMGQTNILLQRSLNYLGKKFFNKLEEILYEKYQNTISFEIINFTALCN